MKHLLLLFLAIVLCWQLNAQNNNTPPNDTPLETEQEILVNAQDAQGTTPSGKSNNWYWWVLLPIAGVVLGFVISKKLNGNNSEIEVEEEPIQPIQKEEESPTPKQAKAKTKSNVNITQLKQKYDKLREDNKVLKQNIATLKNNLKEGKQSLDNDMLYYKAAFQNIVLPLQKAIDGGKHSEIFKMLTIAAIQYSAITREKLSKRQNYDITNIHTLLNEKSDHNNYPELTKDTPTDKTPSNLRQTISILQQLGIKDLDNYIIHGYKLKDL